MSQRLIARVKKLLKLAESTNAHESAAALNKARQLMLEHAITQADLNEIDRESDPIVAQKYVLHKTTLTNVMSRARYSGSRTQQWLRDLFFAIVDYMDMKATYVFSSNVVTVYGHQSDTEIIPYMYDVCARQIDTAWKAYNKVRPDREWVHGKTAGAQFKQSAVVGLRSKLAAMKTSEASPEATTAIALTRKSAVVTWYKEHIEGTTKMRRIKRASHSSEGYNAGKKVRLNAGVGSSGSTRRIA